MGRRRKDSNGEFLSTNFEQYGFAAVCARLLGLLIGIWALKRCLEVLELLRLFKHIFRALCWKKSWTLCNFCLVGSTYMGPER